MVSVMVPLSLKICVTVPNCCARRLKIQTVVGHEVFDPVKNVFQYLIDMMAVTVACGGDDVH